MIPIFSFKKHLFRTILENLELLYPGILKALVFYTSPFTGKLEALEYNSSGNKINEIDPEDYLIDLTKERNSTTPYSWLNADDLLRKINQSISQQLLLEDELKKNVLLIRIENPNDFKMDLLYLFLGKKTGIFPLEKDTSILNTREKGIIAKLTFNYLLLLQSQFLHDKKVFNTYNETFHENRKVITELQKELKITNENYKQSIIEYCKHRLNTISEENGVAYILSEGAINKLSGYKGRFELLDQIITKAAEVAINSSLDSDSEEFLINESDIVFHRYNSQLESSEITKDQQIPLINKYSRAEEILDRYEQAALKVKEAGLSLTGKNIGKHCTPVISHPGIKDSVDKYQKKILMLLDEYPNRWSIIRNEFKTITNLIDRKVQYQRNNAIQK